MIDWLEDLRYSPATWLAIAMVLLLMAAFCAVIAVACFDSYPEGAVFGVVSTPFCLHSARKALIEARALWRADREDA